MMRYTWVLVHRCAGLAIALLLIFSGLILRQPLRFADSQPAHFTNHEGGYP